MDHLSGIERDSSNCGLSQRMVFHCTSIPGETNWVESAYGSGQKTGVVECIVKVYDNGDKFKLNDMIEFIGILSFDPDLIGSSKFYSFLYTPNRE
jgi:hypothetical protein